MENKVPHVQYGLLVLLTKILKSPNVLQESAFRLEPIILDNN